MGSKERGCEDENGGGVACCSYNRRWQRSVKRKREEMEESRIEGGAARVEVENEVAALREALASHQQTVAELYTELEEERAAAASATDEAMSMILRLQREKADVQMEARQFKRVAEERMMHDQQELETLEDKLFLRERAIQALSGEIQAYRRRLLRLGVDLSSPDPDEASDPSIPPENLGYPPLKCCNDLHILENGEIDGDPVSALEHLQNLGKRMDHLERAQEMANPPSAVDSTSNSSGRDEEDDTGDRIYTIDAVHTDQASIKKLYMRLEALEADRESMRQAIVSMSTDKAQLFLLKEIAQNLYQESFSPPPLEKAISRCPSSLERSLFFSIVKWIMSFVLWKHRAQKNKRIFGTQASSRAGLTLLLEKPSPSYRYHQMCFSRTSS